MQLLWLMSLCGVVSGCATMFDYKTQAINLETAQNYVGVNVRVIGTSGSYVATTPTTVYERPSTFAPFEKNMNPLTTKLDECGEKVSDLVQDSLITINTHT